MMPIKIPSGEFIFSFLYSCAHHFPSFLSLLALSGYRGEEQFFSLFIVKDEEKQSELKKI